MTENIYKINVNVHIEAFDEGALILRMPDRNIFQFNLTALKVLELTDGIHDVKEISSVIAKDYHISQEEAVEDVLVLYNHLLDQKIIEQVN